MATGLLDAMKAAADAAAAQAANAAAAQAAAASAAAARDRADRESGKGIYQPQPSGGQVSTASSAPVYSAPAPSPTPALPQYKPDTRSLYSSVKMAPKDTIIFDESNVSIAQIEDLLFEDIGAVELANISRHDLIDGQSVSYSAIKNLSSLKRRFDPNNIIASSLSLQSFFSQFSIDLNSRIGTGKYLNRTKGVPFLDEYTQEIYFYVDTLKTGEVVEIQFLSSGTIDEIGL
jgi:hypothetical protein